MNPRWRPPIAHILENLHTWHTGFIIAGNRCFSVKIWWELLHSREIINVFRKPRRRSPPSWILANLPIWPKASILAGTKCTQLKFGENCFIHVEFNNIFRKFKMAATAILALQKFRYLIRGINTSWYLVYAVKMLGKSLHPCGNYYKFSKFKMAAAAILDFFKCHIWPKKSILVGTRCMLLKFGENHFIHAEIINIFRNSR